MPTVRELVSGHGEPSLSYTATVVQDSLVLVNGTKDPVRRSLPTSNDHPGEICLSHQTVQFWRPSASAKRRAGDSRGSSRFLGLRSSGGNTDTGAGRCSPTPRRATGFLSVRGECSGLAPSQLLFLHQPLAHDLIDWRLDETGSDPFPVAIALPAYQRSAWTDGGRILV